MKRTTKIKYTREIIKIQRPLATNMEPQALVYNEDRSLNAMIPWNNELDDVFDDDLKQYWLADLPTTDGHNVVLIKQVPEQDW